MISSKIVTLSLDVNLIEKSKSHALKTGRTLSGLVKISLEKFIEQEQGVKNE